MDNKAAAEDCQIPKWFGCCCVCRYHVDITGHPWNSGEFKTKITQVIGHGCAVQFSEFLNNQPGALPKVIFHDSEHSICELFDVREELSDWLQSYKALKGKPNEAKS